jgi:hypothetical protein
VVESFGSGGRSGRREETEETALDALLSRRNICECGASGADCNVGCSETGDVT